MRAAFSEVATASVAIVIVGIDRGFMLIRTAIGIDGLGLFIINLPCGKMVLKKKTAKH